MNIFEYLGLPANHRSEAKVTQLVKHFDEVNDKNKEGKNLAVQLKEDGVCAITIIRDGLACIFSRTGRMFTNTKYLIQSIDQLDLRDGVYFGEMITLDKYSLEELSGAVSPNRVKTLGEKAEIATNLRMRMFDLISIESFIKGSSNTKYSTRFSNLLERVNSAYRGSIVSVIEYMPVDSEADIDSHLELFVDCGEEGLIILDLDADWLAGHKGWRKMKKVRGCDYDLLCIGYEDGKGKSKGLVANLLFRWKDGKIIKCSLGKGWTHTMAKNMFEAAEHCHLAVARLRTEPSEAVKQSNPLGKIFQVYALEESSKGKLRLPKVGEQRFDKVEADV